MALFTLLQAGETPTEENLTNDIKGTNAPEGLQGENASNVKLNTETSVSNSANDEQSAPQGGSPWTMWIMLGLIFVVMYFFMIRPQKKQQKELQRFRDSLAKGDKVVTIGGIFGTVVEIKEESVLIEVDNGVKIRVSKQALVKDFSDPSRQ